MFRLFEPYNPLDGNGSNAGRRSGEIALPQDHVGVRVKGINLVVHSGQLEDIMRFEIWGCDIRHVQRLRINGSSDR
jgi:hypothetical protein